MSEEYKYHAFISYSRRDFDEVNAILQKIKTEVPEFNYWLDLESIESGDEFEEKIISAIDNSERILFMLSDNSYQSKWTKEEVKYGRALDKRIIPILLSGAKLKGWCLYKLGYIDGIDTGDTRQMSKLISNLRQWCGGKSSSPIPPTSPQKELEIPERIKKDGKWGYKNKKGEIVIPFIYDWVDLFSEGRAGVKKDGKYGYIDLDGNIVIPLIYDVTRRFREGRAVVEKAGKWGFIDVNGNTVIPFIYDWGNSFSDGRAQVKKDGKYGFIDLDGNIVIPLIYDDTHPFREGRAGVKKAGKYGYIDLNGNTVIPFIYDDAGPFSEGRADVEKDGKYGCIDVNGNTVKPFIYDALNDPFMIMLSYFDAAE